MLSYSNNTIKINIVFLLVLISIFSCKEKKYISSESIIKITKDTIINNSVILFVSPNKLAVEKLKKNMEKKTSTLLLMMLHTIWMRQIICSRN